MILAGCGIATPSGSVAPASVPPPSASPSATTSPATARAPSASGPAVIPDETLLDLLPAAGFTITYDPETTAQVAADPSLAVSVRALAIALAMPAGEVTPGSSLAPGADLAVVSVIRLRDPSVDETWFRDWRDSYDEAACANAGGFGRRAETVIGGRTVFSGSCAGGSFTYHVRVDDDAVVISLTSIGPGRIGQSIMERLAP